jgi:hypothetical protein
MAQLLLGMAAAVAAFSRRWWVRLGVGCSLLLLALHLLLNRLLLPLANSQLLPGVLSEASRISMRQVGRCCEKCDMCDKVL